jgi:hypothetical protein
MEYIVYRPAPDHAPNLPCTTAWISKYRPVCSPDQRRASTACSRSTGSKALRSARHQKPHDRILEIANLFLAREKGNLPRGNGIFPRATDVVAGNRGCSRFTKSAFHRGRICASVCVHVCVCVSLSLSRCGLWFLCDSWFVRRALVSFPTLR